MRTVPVPYVIRRLISDEEAQALGKSQHHNAEVNGAVAGRNTASDLRGHTREDYHVSATIVVMSLVRAQQWPEQPVLDILDEPETWGDNWDRESVLAPLYQIATVRAIDWDSGSHGVFIKDSDPIWLDVAAACIGLRGSQRDSEYITYLYYSNKKYASRGMLWRNGVVLRPPAPVFPMSDLIRRIKEVL